MDFIRNVAAQRAKRELQEASRGPPRAVYSIGEFCTAHGISQAQFYAFKKRGLGPAEMHVGRRRLISFEAAAAWRQAREAVLTED